MSIFEKLASHDHEQVIFCRDAETGLKAIIGIHDTTLGPALGGCRMWPFASDEEALEDVLRLSRGMTFKASVAGLDLGGGKTVVIGDPKTQKSESLFRALGRFIEGLDGRYITAEDVGTNTDDMAFIHRETEHVRGCSRGEGGSGDPSPVTAFGTFRGIQAGVKWALGLDELHGLTVALQGAGHVGYHLAKELARAGCSIVVCDIDEQRAARVQEECGARIVPVDDIFDEECDVFAPCALGGALNTETIQRLRCCFVGGAANNQLQGEQSGMELAERGILYGPDYVLNAGGLINVAHEGPNYNRQLVMEETTRIYGTTLRIFGIAKSEGLRPEEAAQHVAEERVRAGGRLKRIWHS
jgi:leucine dehydrogenase